MRKLAISTGIAGLLLSACSAYDPADESVSKSSEAIRNGQTENGRQYVVALRIEMNDATTRFCSGVLFAPRTVLTAAHCVSDENTLAEATRVLVYAGNNYDADIAPLLPDLEGVPPPPQTSKFMWADSWETHPNWNTDLIFPDLAAVYLDRKPNFDPLPLDRNRLGSSDVGSALTLFGYGAIDGSGNGARVKRRGASQYRGAPLLADAPIGPDRHPGITNQTVVNGLLKAGGTSAQACLGDSGGPAIKNRWGQDYVAGIFSWGTTDCTSFSYYTRIDPFLPFVDEAYRKGGQAVVKPRLECVQSLPNSKFRAYFGYQNDNGINVQVPYGTKNSFAQDSSSQRPTNFIHGAHGFDFRVTASNSTTMSWKLSPTNSPTTTVTAKSSSPKCSTSNPAFVCATACEASLALGCGETFRECQASCIGEYEFFSAFGCDAESRAVNQCVAGLPSSSFECFDSPHGFPVDGCQDENDALIACLCDNGGC